MIQDLFFRDHRPKTDNQNEEAAMKRQADRLVRDLINAKLLECGMVWYESEAGFPYPYRYLQITALGADVLVEYRWSQLSSEQRARYTTQAEIRKAKESLVRYRSHRKDKGQDSARHTLEISRFYVALQRACWRRGVTLRYWADDRQLAAMDKRETLLTHIPDAFFILERGGQLFTHCLEADRGTETLVSDKGRTTDLLTKYTRYGEHIKYSFAQAPFFQGLPLPVVLNVTTGGPVRRDNMMETAHQAGGRGSYWFTTANELYASKDADSFWGEVWQVPAGASCRSLLTRLEIAS